MDAKQSEVKAAGLRFQREEESLGGYQLISVIYGAEETQDPNTPVGEKWELVGNDMEKSIWELPAVQNQFARLTSLGMSTANQITFIARFRADVEALIRGESITVDVNGTEVALNTDYILDFVVRQLRLSQSVFAGLILSLAKGVESYTVSQYVLRHTRVVVRRSNLKPSTTNIGKIFATTADLRSKESIPTLLFDLPEGVWLKRTPTQEQSSADKYDITQEYWHADSYDTFVHEQAT